MSNRIIYMHIYVIVHNTWFYINQGEEKSLYFLEFSYNVSTLDCCRIGFGQ